MNGGVGPNSYVQNSAYQGLVLDVAKSIITDEISTKLDVEQLCASSPNNPFYIVDFGCATGDNSIAAIQMIIYAVDTKFDPENNNNINIPEFQVFFNDRITNDFNTLFNSLPAVWKYHCSWGAWNLLRPPISEKQPSLCILVLFAPLDFQSARCVIDGDGSQMESLFPIKGWPIHF